MKKLTFLSIVLALFLGSSLLLAQTQIQSGSFSVNNTNTGYTLDKNSGERSVTVEVNFVKPFDKKPDVVLSVTALDADTKSNVRYSVEATSISRDGFTVKINTWSETKIYSIGGSWLAHAQ